jgi:transketolase
MQIFCPADEDELIAALPAILRSPAPCYVRHNACRSRLLHAPFEIGTAEALSDGEDVAILTYGFLVTEAVDALDILQAKGVSVRLINLRSLKPIDEHAVIDAAASTGLILTLEDHFVAGGLFSIVAEILVRAGIRCAVSPIALEERWFRPGLLRDVLSSEGFSSDRIVEKVLDIVRKRSRLADVCGGFE